MNAGIRLIGKNGIEWAHQYQRSTWIEAKAESQVTLIITPNH
jgi:hypothetical protein